MRATFRQYRLTPATLALAVAFLVLVPSVRAFEAVQAEDFLELTLPREFVDDAHWDGVLDREGGQSVTFGVEISGPSPYSRNAGRKFIPASVTKLFTTGASLELLGGEFRYRTRMEWRRVSADDPSIVTELRLIGEGDPTWGMVEFGENLRTRVSRFAEALKKTGVRQVQGEIRADAADERWNELGYPFGWSPEDEVECYGALAQSFNLDINCAFYEVRGAQQGRWVESGVPIPVRLEIRAGAQTSLIVKPIRRPGGVSDGFVIGGTWARGTQPQRLYLPIHRAKVWIAALLRDELLRAGIQVTRIRPRPGAPGVREQGPLEYWESTSPSLSEIVRPLNKSSLNMLADALFKTLGQRFGAPTASLNDAGREVLAAYIEGLGSRAANAMGMQPIPGFYSDQLLFWDGSGISRKNSVTTTGMMALLTHLTLSSQFAAIWESLPIAGTDGTLETRMRGTAAEGILRGKTGTLRGAYNLAGYVPRFDRSGGVSEFVPFVVLGETSVENKTQARAAQDRLGAALVTAINGGAGSRRLLP